MKERPILFSGPMVRALLAGSKTQTRRVCKPAATLSAVVEVPDPMERGQVYNGSHFGDEDGEVQFASPYGGRGDRLWVRESFMPVPLEAAPGPSQTPWSIAYAAGSQTELLAPSSYNPTLYNYERWTPSIHMPRWASRITLEITSVRVERLQDISRGDAMAEGCPFPNMAQGPDPRDWYAELWGAINGPDSWDANPWVWVVEFKAIEAKP